MIKKISMTILVIIGAYLSICLLLYVVQENLLFFPRKITC